MYMNFYSLYNITMFLTRNILHRLGGFVMNIDDKHTRIYLLCHAANKDDMHSMNSGC